jgi:agmatine/peptidylarginine deiminase
MYSQDFEGIITYKIEYTSNNTKLSDKELQEEMGTDVTTYFKNGYYKEDTNSQFMSYQLYRHKDTLVYFKNNTKSDTLYFHKTTAKADVDFSYEISKKTDTILGYVCDQLAVKDKYGTKTYYYSSELSLNPSYYKNFTSSNKDKIVSLMQAVYLRLDMSFPEISVHIIATDVRRKKLKKSTFKLPKHTALIESEI